jgi:2-oxoglutarate dehydrogenase E2 component (dihydrolipoamide succinyltransferase)
MTVEIKVPAMGESVTEATISKWFKKEGDAVKRDEPLLELETDKVTVEVPSPTDGAIESISAQAGATVQVGALLAPSPKAKPGLPQRLRKPKRLSRQRRPPSAPCSRGPESDAPAMPSPSAFPKKAACPCLPLPAPAATAASPRATCWARLRRVPPPLPRSLPRPQARATMRRARKRSR